MTSSQLEKVIVTDLGYSFGELISLNEVSSIVLDIDNSIYPEKDTMFKFKKFSDNTIMMVYFGKKNSDGNYEFNASSPNLYIDASTIYAFNLVTPLRRKSPYLYGRSV